MLKESQLEGDLVKGKAKHARIDTNRLEEHVGSCKGSGFTGSDMWRIVNG